MFYSKKLNLLFIACPKTGSRSVEKFLEELDSNGEKHTLTVNGKKISGNDIQGRIGHAKAWEIKDAMGHDEYNSLRVIGFARDPFEKLVSSYFFNKRGILYKSFLKNNKWKFDLTGAKKFLTKLFAKILPFSLWILVYPMKTNYEYFFDNSGNRIVKYIGRTDHLNEDLKLILDNIGIDISSKIPHINKSMDENKDKYFKYKFLNQHLKRRYKNDLELYSTANKEMIEMAGV